MKEKYLYWCFLFFQQIWWKRVQPFWTEVCSSWTLVQDDIWKTDLTSVKSIDIFLISSVVYHSQGDQNEMSPNNDERQRKSSSVDIVLSRNKSNSYHVWMSKSKPTFSTRLRENLKQKYFFIFVSIILLKTYFTVLIPIQHKKDDLF